MTRGTPDIAYYMENVGGAGITAADAPCVKGTTLGAVRVGNPAAGVIIRGDTLSAVTPGNRIAGGQTAGGSLTIGNSTTSFQNVVLTDNLTTINTPLTLVGAGNDLVVPDDISVGGNVVLANGPSGKSISGYYSANVAIVGAGAVANPAGLTDGVYLAVYVGAGAGNENAQPSGVFYYSSVGGWSGNAVSFNFTAGAPNCAIAPAAGGATLVVGGASVPANGTVYFRKLLN